MQKMNQKRPPIKQLVHGAERQMHSYLSLSQAFSHIVMTTLKLFMRAGRSETCFPFLCVEECALLSSVYMMVLYAFSQSPNCTWSKYINS